MRKHDENYSYDKEIIEDDKLKESVTTGEITNNLYVKDYTF